jgi:hypothetical protein
MKNKKDITFTCYKYDWDEGTGTLFLFWPDGVWDEDKLTIHEALDRYPVSEYEWIHTD